MAVVVDEFEVVTAPERPPEQEPATVSKQAAGLSPASIAEEIERLVRRRAERMARLEAS
jgi:hypothetical protein